MSTILLGACWPLQMEPTTKAVLISLADQANDDGVCWPSVGTISRRTCYAERTVQEAIRRLAEWGYLLIEERPGRSSLYRLTPAAGAPLSQPKGRKPPPQQAHPSAQTPPHVAHPTPAAGAPPGVQVAHPEPSFEPSVNHQTPSDEASSPATDHPAAEPGELDLDQPEQPSAPPVPNRARPPGTPGAAVFDAYRIAYRRRYGTDPIRGAKENSQCAQIARRLPADEAPGVVACYLASEEALYVRAAHPLDLLQRDLQKFTTENRTGRAATPAQARERERVAMSPIAALQQQAASRGALASAAPPTQPEALRGPR